MLYTLHDCGACMSCALESITKNVAVVNLSLLGRYGSMVVVYGVWGSYLPLMRERYVMHILPCRKSGAPMLPTTVVIACPMNRSASPQKKM